MTRQHPGEVSCWDLFAGFLQVGVQGFGGVIMPWARRMAVEERGWLDDAQFTRILGLAQPLPGPNSVNLAIMLGDRLRGLPGALAALAGMMLAPLAIMLAVAAAFEHFGQAPLIRRLLPGISAAAAGLVLGVGMRLALQLERKAWALALLLATFLAVAVFHLPLLPVLVCLAPIGFACGLLAGRRAS